MAGLMNFDFFALIIVGLATLFLIGEILVNMRGAFALLGITLITLYFYLNLADLGTFALMFIIFFVGLLLVFIDGKFVNDGTLAILGIVGMMIAVGLTAPNLTAGLYAVIGLIAGFALAFSFLKIFKRRNMWNKLTLKDRLTREAGYSSINEEYEELINKIGVTVTDLRPVGTIKIEDKEYSAISNAQWIHKGTTVVVVTVDGTKILVKSVNES